MARKKAEPAPVATPQETPSGFPQNLTETELRDWLASQGFSFKNAERPKPVGLTRIAAPLIFCPPIERSTEAPEGDLWCKVSWVYLRAGIFYNVESVTIVRKEIEKVITTKEVVYAECEQ